MRGLLTPRIIMEETMFIDPQRCIGCRACVAACRECATHKGYPMIFVDYIDRAETTATMPTVCMHCNEPTQAEFKTFQRNLPTGNNRKSKTGHAAVWQARLIMLVMINIAQLWILAATIDAA